MPEQKQSISVEIFMTVLIVRRRELFDGLIQDMKVIFKLKFTCQ